MTEVYPIEADGGKRSGSAGHPSEGLHNLGTEGLRAAEALASTGAVNASSPPGHTEDEGVLPLDVRGLLLGAHGGELPREEVDRPREPLVDSPADRMRLSSRYARHLVAEYLVDACPLLTARQVWYELSY